MKSNLQTALFGSIRNLSLGLLLVSPVMVYAESYYFFVKNASDSRIVKLEVSENKRKWGYFDIGGGIAIGKKVRLEWDSNAEGQSCEQWMRAKFADGSTSEPSKLDFCEDLDDPVIFE